MSEEAKRALEALESAAGNMSATDLAYLTGYAEGAASANARNPDDTEEAEEE